MVFAWGFFASALTVLYLALARASYRASNCRIMPGDPGWPSTNVWNQLNATVSGELITTVPLAAPCYGAARDEQKCGSLKEQWELPAVSKVRQADIASR
jgi:hypothetical protein